MALPTLLTNAPPSAQSVRISFSQLESTTGIQTRDNQQKHFITIVSFKTQSPPSFPGGEDKLNAFVLDQIEEAERPIKLGRKTWLTATLNGTGKVIELVPTYNSDPTLKKEMAQVGAVMPCWNLGTINEQGVETKCQFLLRR